MTNGNKALVTVMTARLDHVMHSSKTASQRSYGLFAVNEDT